MNRLKSLGRLLLIPLEIVAAGLVGAFLTILACAPEWAEIASRHWQTLTGRQ